MGKLNVQDGVVTITTNDDREIVLSLDELNEVEKATDVIRKLQGSGSLENIDITMPEPS